MSLNEEINRLEHESRTRLREIQRLRNVVREQSSQIEEMTEILKEMTSSLEKELNTSKDVYMALSIEENISVEEVVKIIAENKRICDKFKPEHWIDTLIEITWCLDDIRCEIEEKYTHVEPTEENCRKIADFLRRNHDAGVGINWDVIYNAIEACFPEAERICD